MQVIISQSIVSHIMALSHVYDIAVFTIYLFVALIFTSRHKLGLTLLVY